MSLDKSQGISLCETKSRVSPQRTKTNTVHLHGYTHALFSFKCRNRICLSLLPKSSLVPKLTECHIMLLSFPWITRLNTGEVYDLWCWNLTSYCCFSRYCCCFFRLKRLTYTGTSTCTRLSIVDLFESQFKAKFNGQEEKRSPPQLVCE